MAGRRDPKKLAAAVRGIVRFAEQHPYEPMPDMLFCKTCGESSLNTRHTCSATVRTGKASLPCGNMLPCERHSRPKET